MNPFCQWVDGGRRFKCNVCPMVNEVPVEYFSTLDANGIRWVGGGGGRGGRCATSQIARALLMHVVTCL